MACRTSHVKSTSSTWHWTASLTLNLHHKPGTPLLPIPPLPSTYHCIPPPRQSSLHPDHKPPTKLAQHHHTHSTLHHTRSTLNHTNYSFPVHNPYPKLPDMNHNYYNTQVLSRHLRQSSSDQRPPPSSHIVRGEMTSHNRHPSPIPPLQSLTAEWPWQRPQSPPRRPLLPSYSQVARGQAVDHLNQHGRQSNIAESHPFSRQQYGYFETYV